MGQKVGFLLANFKQIIRSFSHTIATLKGGQPKQIILQVIGGSAVCTEILSSVL